MTILNTELWFALVSCFCLQTALSLNPVQVLSHGAEEEKGETARLVCNIYSLTFPYLN